MKKFDLERAKAGDPVCTRDGRPARIICFDRRYQPQLVALIDIGGKELICLFDSCGISDSPALCDDLFMATQKKTVWVNLYNCSEGILTSAVVYRTKEIAEREHCSESCLGAYPIEIEV